MINSYLKYLIFALSLFVGNMAFASDVVVLKNGNIIKGTVVSKTETKIAIKSENGNIYEYPLIEVQSISNLEKLSNVGKKDVQETKTSYIDYGELDSGFWVATELGEAASCNLNGGNYTFTELDVVGGYRLNEYIRFGIGIGARYYNNNSHRYSSIAWGVPIYASIRGNIIPCEYRNVVPYYSFDVGASIRDGFMLRPGVGVRIGQNRSAFLVSLSYLGQNIISKDDNRKKNKFTSFVMVKIGYEF